MQVPMTLTALATMMAIQATNHQSEISSLSDRANSLTHRVTHWNVAYLIFLALTVLNVGRNAGCVGIDSLGNIKLGRAQERTGGGQEENLTRELKEKDLEIAKAQELASNAQRDLEAEKLKRLEMEKSFAPRSIPLIVKKDGPSNIDGLKPFAGIK